MTRSCCASPFLIIYYSSEVVIIISVFLQTGCMNLSFCCQRRLRVGIALRFNEKWMILLREISVFVTVIDFVSMLPQEPESGVGL